MISKNHSLWILHQVVVLLSIVSFLEAQNPPPTPNPECNTMNTAAKHLKNTLKLVIKKDAQCKPNQHCTGVKCSWSNEGLLEVDLHHCQDPVNYHVFFKYPDNGISKNLTLKQGDEKTLYRQQLITIKVKVTKLKRTNDVVTTSVTIQACTIISGCSPITTMNDKQFCVRMQNCPGFNASAHHYTPCGYKPTSPATKQPSSTTSAFTGPHTKQPSSASTGPHTKKPSSTTSASTGPHTKHPSSASTGPHTKQPTSASTGPHTKQPKSKSASTGPHTKPPQDASTGHIKTKPSPHQHSPSSVSPSNGTILHRKGEEGDNKKGLSTAAIIGICAAAVVAILVVVGVAVYWKKYHHRSRLRAAYYNDISMHDPLYEDFGPEVA